MDGPYEVVIVGGGHNGLTAAVYLARAGRAVCVVERRPVLGGACVTEELLPGAGSPPAPISSPHSARRSSWASS